MAFTKVDKMLGENVKSVKRLSFKPTNSTNINTFSSNRKRYLEYLAKEGYQTFTHGNYITANKENETNTFYFISHNANLHNYLIPVNLENRVQYFVFFDERTSQAYVVAYNKVREYCKNVTKAVKFTSSGDPKMLIPDSWANNQVLNTNKI